MKLEKEEVRLREAYERSEFRRIRNVEKEKDALMGAAKATLNKDRRINIRLTSRDLELIQKKAVKVGVPYQTLISSLIHKYVTEQVKEV